MVEFCVLNSEGRPAVGISITISVPGGKKRKKLTDERGFVSFEINEERGGIMIDNKPWYYGSLDVDVFQLPYS